MTTDDPTLSFITPRVAAGVLFTDDQNRILMVVPTYKDHDDQIFGEREVDYLVGGDGDDLIDAGRGDDIGLGGSGDDTLMGGQGDDLLDGGLGGNGLLGDRGADICVGGPVIEGCETWRLTASVDW